MPEFYFIFFLGGDNYHFKYAVEMLFSQIVFWVSFTEIFPQPVCDTYKTRLSIEY